VQLMKMVSFLKTVKNQPYLNMFKKKRSNKGVMWASLISLGISTLMMMLSKGKRQKVTSSFQNLTKNITSKSAMPLMNNALAEFGAEFFTKDISAKDGAAKRNNKDLTEFGEEFHSKNISANLTSNTNNNEIKEFAKEIQSNNIPGSGEISNMDDAALTKFSEELVSKAIEDK
jgi:(p)ppGpp synthase/HD superfamily hydrolase